jgi:hypothetical protein
MAARTTAPVITSAIISILMGLFLLTCGVCGAVNTFGSSNITVNNKDITPEYDAHMNKEVPIYPVINYGDVILRFLLALTFLGVATLLFTPYAKFGQPVGLLAALVSLGHQLIVVIWQLVFIMPARSEFFKKYPLLDLGGFTSKVGAVWVVGWAVLFVLGDLAILVCLALPGTWKALWRPAEQLPEEDDKPSRRRGRARWEDDEDEDRIRARDDY